MFYQRSWLFWLLFGIVFVIAAVVIPLIIAMLFKTGNGRGGTSLYTKLERQQRQDDLILILSSAGVIDDPDPTSNPTIDESLLLNGISSPQYKAFQWIVNSKLSLSPLDYLDKDVDDPSSLSSSSRGQEQLYYNTGEDSATIIVERYIMAVFYYATNMKQAKKQLSKHGSSGGNNDDKTKNLWLSDLPVCDWDEGIICDSDDDGDGGEQSGNDFTTVSTTARFPESPTSSSSSFAITRISMSGYLLTGSIPKEVSYLSHLQELVLGTFFVILRFVIVRGGQ